MIVDIVMLSNCKKTYFRELTESTIFSLRASEPDITFFVVVVESDIELRKEHRHHIQQADVILYPDLDQEFGYNRFMNVGVHWLMENTSEEYVALCNNDLVFKMGWCKNLIDGMKKHNLLSACPVDPFRMRHKDIDKESDEVFFGYDIRPYLPGWCIMQKYRDLYKIIGPLDEQFEFWFADSDYGLTLKKHGVKHGLVSNSHVHHLGYPDGPTINSMSTEDYNRLTKEPEHLFNRKWKLGPYEEK